MRVFKKCPDGEFPKRGTWRPVLSDGARTAVVCCADCDFRSSLAGSHTIAADGTVSPSVVCASQGCAFHEFIKLEGWSG